MAQEIEIILYGSLRDTRPASISPADRRIPLTEATPLADVIHLLDIARDNIQLAMLNHRAVSIEAVVRPGDRLALFPKEYPIFLDWNDFRL